MVQAHLDAMSAPHHPGFFQRKSVQTVLPFLTSLAFHAGIVALALSLYQAVTVMTTPPSEPHGPVSIEIDGRPLNLNITVPGVRGIGDDPTRPMAQNEFFDTDPNSTQFKPSSAGQVDLTGGSSGNDNAASNTIGIGDAGRRGKGVGTGFGDFIGPGSGSPKGKPTRFGTPGEGSKDVFVLPQARNVVYVCDATGSMTPVFSGLRRELGNAIDKLGQKDVQFFNVMFFSDDKVLSLSPQLIRADVAGKAKAAAFIEDTTSRGQTNPLPAIRAAFAQKPEVIYVLTDGFDQVNDLDSVVKEFDVLNKDRSVRVNTILLGTVEQKDLVEALKKIAEQNGGTMKIVSKEDF